MVNLGTQHEPAESNFNKTQKVQAGAAKWGQNFIVINPQNIEFARGLTNSQKDKRLTMFPEDIKRFIVDNNKERAVMKDFESTLRNQDIKTKVKGQPTSYGTASDGPNNRVVSNKNLASITTLNSSKVGGVLSGP